MRFFSLAAIVLTIVGTTASALRLDAQPGHHSPNELENLVSQITLYPDPPLAQILAAATYPEQVADAARWSDEHHYLTDEPLAQAMADDRLTWDRAFRRCYRFHPSFG